jgi:hypothetical protein
MRDGSCPPPDPHHFDQYRQGVHRSDLRSAKARGNSTIHAAVTQHWVGKAPSLSNARWLKRALGAAQNRDRSKLLAEDFDLSLLGITDEDLDALLRDPDQVEGGAVEGEYYIPESSVTPRSVAGDLWQLGSHRLICGDSTSADGGRAAAG